MITIENTDKWVLRSKGNGACFEMINKATLETKFVQYGDDSTAFYAEYVSIGDAFADVKSAWHKQSWNDCLAYLWDII